MITNTTTVAGNVTADPELRVVGDGTAVTTLRMAHNHRVRDKDGSWVDAGEPLFLDVTCWRYLAQNVCQSLVKGDSVVVTGRLKQRTWVDPEGNPRVKVEMEADTVAADLSRHAARLVRRRDPEPSRSEEPEPRVDLVTGEVLDEASDASEEAGDREPVGAAASNGGTGHAEEAPF